MSRLTALLCLASVALGCSLPPPEPVVTDPGTGVAGSGTQADPVHLTINYVENRGPDGGVQAAGFNVSGQGIVGGGIGVGTVPGNPIHAVVPDSTDSGPITPQDVVRRAGIRLESNPGSMCPGETLIGDTAGANAFWLQTGKIDRGCVKGSGDFLAGYTLLLNPLGGNVAIGRATVPAWDGSLTAINIGVRGSVSADPANTFVGANYYSTSKTDKYMAPGPASQYWLGDGGHNFRVSGAGLAGDDIHWQNAVTITKAGKVGIGTTAPSEMLVVGDDIGPRGSSNTVVIGGNSNLNTGSALILGYSPTSYAVLDYGPNGNLRLFAQRNGVTRDGIQIQPATGNVAIGTEDPKDNKLLVAGGDVRTASPGNGLVVASPNGMKCARIGIDNNGAIAVTPVPCL